MSNIIAMWKQMIIEAALDTLVNVLTKPNSKLGKKLIPFLTSEKTQKTFSDVFMNYNALVDRLEGEED